MGRLIKAWASQKSFQSKEPPPDDPGKSTANVAGHHFTEGDFHCYASQLDKKHSLWRARRNHEKGIGCGNDGHGGDAGSGRGSAARLSDADVQHDVCRRDGALVHGQHHLQFFGGDDCVLRDSVYLYAL
jgi:hypothetical protein